jgi:16S rRNA (guanine527-N7)-methyltransferase
MDNIEVLCLRAETAAHKENLREQFFFAAARGVSALPVLLEYCLPFLTIGSNFAAIKGPLLNEELALSTTAITTLNTSTPQIHAYTLPFSSRSSNVAIFPKIAATPNKYPRREGIPEKRPL